MQLIKRKAGTLLPAFFLLCAFIFSESSSAISRVGNGRIGNMDTGFSFPVPSNFYFKGKTPLDALVFQARRQIIGSSTLPPGFNQPVSLYFKEFTADFSEYVDFNREDFSQFLFEVEQTKWTKIDSFDLPDCVDAYEASNENVLAVLLRWGPDRGFFAHSENNFQVQAALTELLEGFDLDEAFCSWNQE